ncbi:MAG: hypothetical protein R2838_19475 [Caldilineaceae bacterium]
MHDDGIRIAMWSGPRNISTAMLRSWGNRPDAFVSDEPFYAYYLKATGIDHPGAAETIATYETDWHAIADALTGPIPGGKSVWYQKHMTHHMLPEVDLDWTEHVVNCFLIRSPQEMITSYIKVRPDPTLQDMGLAEQRAIFDHVRARTGAVPPVIDARDVLLDPARTLSLLCEAIGVPFTDAMLHWPAGKRRHRRHLGQVLVQRGGSVHRLRALPAQGRAGPGPAPAVAGRVQRALRRNVRTPHPLTAAADITPTRAGAATPPS